MKKMPYKKTITISTITILIMLIAIGGAIMAKNNHLYAHDGEYHTHKYHGEHDGKYRKNKKHMSKWFYKTLIKEQSNEDMKIRAQRWFNRLDADNNDTITKEDISDIKYRKINKMWKKFTKTFDTDEDGTVKREEYQNAVTQIITKADQNNDQKLSKDEIRNQLRQIFGKKAPKYDFDNDKYSTNSE